MVQRSAPSTRAAANDRTITSRPKLSVPNGCVNDGDSEGDICVTNDPYSGFVATHPPDMHIWKPVFWQGELVCFVGGHIHNTDVGGAVPASLSRTLTEIYQEGIRIPPTKLFERGVLDQRLLDILSMNVRLPEQNRGDPVVARAFVRRLSDSLAERIPAADLVDRLREWNIAADQPITRGDASRLIYTAEALSAAAAQDGLR